MADSTANHPWMCGSIRHADIEDDRIPRLGMEFENIEDVWQFWINYGGLIGFDGRKQWINKDKKNENITSTRFVCNKEGHRREDKRDHLTKHPRAETRTNCPAHIGIRYIKETGKYQVHDFIAEHSHALHLAETIHMMPSQRKISKTQAAEIDLAEASGITTKASFELISRHGGGKSSVGYTLLDQKNYLRSKRQRNLMYGEAGSLLMYFQQQLLENPSFFHAMQLDNEEQITNIFWADAKMIIDYANFGDVITFDTTYSTNKEFRPLGVFIGFNHHRKIVIFGAALLYDETCESFEWLFRTFLEAHQQKKPLSIFTDQDLAMASALRTVMPETYHGLCTWHIMQNAVKQLGNMLKDGSNLLKDFKACMYKYEDEITFEIAWELMLSHYNVQESTWLSRIYEVKEKWAKCYMKNAYTLGMRSTQLSESLNGDLKDYLKSDLNVNQFFKHFERVVEDKRYNELKAEYASREKLPKLRMHKSPLLQQATKVYTPSIFELFQEEYDWSLATLIKERKEAQDINEYKVVIFDQDGEYIVKGNPSTRTISCSCRKFETFGILCCHALKVLDVMDIKLIPDQYILKRWTRKAKSKNIENVNGKEVYRDVNLDITRRYRYLCSKLVKLASQASEFEDAYTLLDKAIDELTKKIEKVSTNHPTSSGDEASTSIPNKNALELENLTQNVKGLKKRTGRKGRKRLKSWVEKLQNKKKKGTKKDSFENQPLQAITDGQLQHLQPDRRTRNAFSGLSNYSDLLTAMENESQVLTLDSAQFPHSSNILTL